MPDDNAVLLFGFQEDEEPDLYQEDTLQAIWSDPKFTPGDEYSEDYTGNVESIDTGLAISPAITDYVQTGLFNSSFRLGPPDPSRPIDNATNPLPYWKVVDRDWYQLDQKGDKNSGVEIYWQESTLSPSGYSLLFDVNAADGGTGESLFGLSQTVPTSANHQWMHFHVFVGPESGTAGAGLSDAFSIGRVAYNNVSTAVQQDRPAILYDDAHALVTGRYAVGFEKGGGSGALGNWELDQSHRYTELMFGHTGFGGTRQYSYEVFGPTAKKPPIRWATIPVVNNNWTQNESGKALYVGGNGDWTTYAFATGYYISSFLGVFLGVGARVQSARTQGNIEVTGRSSTSTGISPVARIDASPTNNGYGKYTIGEWANYSDWTKDENERIFGSLDATSWLPTSNVCLAHLHLALFEMPDDSGL